MFAEVFSAAGFKAMIEVLIIDVVLAGDNAIVVGLAAAGLPPEQRRRAIILGIGAAAIMRIGFALMTTQLLQVKGLLLIGGLLLVWVCWKMYQELTHMAEDARTMEERLADAETEAGSQPKSMAQAMWQIVIADVSMSLDNVLAVAGAAREHPIILIFGLAVSVVLMGVAASFIARLIEKHRWIAWVGLLVIVYVAARMVWEGGWEVAEYMGWATAPFHL
ncbi:MAG: TerC family protein [Alphaproteobacteria bacterium]|nr:TerC family protein [Alphaproteobacteria bacterium]